MVRLSQGVGTIELHITGTVQGVGFRPHVYKLATALGLKGWVINTTAGVTIRLEGAQETLDEFCASLRSNPPALARIETFDIKSAPFEGFSAFFIKESEQAQETQISIPPDVGTCPDCLREYYDSSDRRAGYAFTNCVNCGPRFSITKAAPYDRKNTSMHVFPLCKDCAEEYTNPADRRFHAEPNACPVCGPKITITDADGKEVQAEMRTLLKAGKILAVKGIGGYHLACNALDNAAVALLRRRKRRQSKPFAVMCRDLEVIRQYCELSLEEEKLLTSSARPIVLLRQKTSYALSPDIAPGLNTLGVMLPNTPLHYGLFDEDLTILIMTSANISGDPLILTEEEAYEQLGGIADYFVTHNRMIINRSDDSVAYVFRGEAYFIRRSRGYVPQTIKLPRETGALFAAGGDLKSAFAYAKGNKVTFSQYFGDLDNLKNFHAYKHGAEFFKDFLDIEPERAVCDLHPDYISTQYAKELALPHTQVQHHKAHFASCAADNFLNEKLLGVVCDGTGYGEDGSIWGCEFFYGDYLEIARVGSLQPYSQPRGDAVQKHPLHMAAVLLYQLYKDEEQVLDILPESRELMPYVKAQVGSERLSLESTSAGRIFDAAAALWGFTEKVTYEGEAAMCMEAAAEDLEKVQAYPVTIYQDEIYRISLDFLKSMAEDKRQGTAPKILAAKFHATFAQAIIAMLQKLQEAYAADKVVFSGGTFQNRLLIEYLDKKLPRHGLIPYFHRQVPANDGGLALGQIMLAMEAK